MISLFNGAINVRLYLKRYGTNDDYVEITENGTVDMVYGVPYLGKAVIEKADANDTNIYSIDVNDIVFGDNVGKTISINDDSVYYFPFGNYKYVESPTVFDAHFYVKGTRDDGSNRDYDNYYFDFKVNSIPLPTSEYSNIDARTYLSTNKNIQLGDCSDNSSYNDFDVLYGCASNHDYVETKMYLPGHRTNRGLPIKIFTDCMPIVVIDSIIVGDILYVKKQGDNFKHISEYEACDAPPDYSYSKINVKLIDEGNNIAVDYTSSIESSMYRTIPFPQSLLDSGLKKFYIEYTYFICSDNGDCVKQYTIKTKKPVMFYFASSFTEVPNMAHITTIYDNITKEEVMLFYGEVNKDGSVVVSETFIPDVRKKDFSVKGHFIYKNVVGSDGHFIVNESESIQTHNDKTFFYDFKNSLEVGIGGAGLYVVNYFLGSDGVNPKMYSFLAQELKIPFDLEILLRDEDGVETPIPPLISEYTPYCQKKHKSFPTNKQYDIVFKVKRNDSNIRNRVKKHTNSYYDPITKRVENVAGQDKNIPVQDTTVTRKMTLGEKTYCLRASIQLNVEYGLTL